MWMKTHKLNLVSQRVGPLLFCLMLLVRRCRSPETISVNIFGLKLLIGRSTASRTAKTNISVRMNVEMDVCLLVTAIDVWWPLKLVK